jgi:hypothetical protein
MIYSLISKQSRSGLKISSQGTTWRGIKKIPTLSGIWLRERY